MRREVEAQSFRLISLLVACITGSRLAKRLVAAVARAAFAAIVTYCIYVVAVILLVHIAHRAPQWLEMRLLVLAVQGAFLAVICAGLRMPAARFSRGTVRAGGVRAATWFSVGSALFAALGAMTLVSTSTAPEMRLPYSHTLSRWAADFPVTGLAGRFLAFIVIGPALEEFLFRSLILGYLLRTTRSWFALLVSTALFASVHSNWLHAFFAGLAYGLLYLRYRSILLCIFAHGVNNLVAASGAGLLIAYLNEAGFLMPLAENLLPLQVAWLSVAFACLAMFLHTLFWQRGRIRWEWIAAAQVEADHARA